MALRLATPFLLLAGVSALTFAFCTPSIEDSPTWQKCMGGQDGTPWLELPRRGPDPDPRHPTLPWRGILPPDPNVPLDWPIRDNTMRPDPVPGGFPLRANVKPVPDPDLPLDRPLTSDVVEPTPDPDLPLDLPISAAPPDAINPDILPPQSRPHGLPYYAWADRWWQWIDAQPLSANPLVDESGEDCARGQTGPVWFLAGSPSGSYTRRCTIPAGKSLFFPVVNFQEDQREAVVDLEFFRSDECSDDDGPGPEFCASASRLFGDDPTMPANMLAFLDFVMLRFVDIDNKFASIDDKPVKSLRSYRAPSDTRGYRIALPDTEDAYDNYHTIWGYEFDGPDAYLGVQDGYYLMVKPLPPGEHTIRFGEPGWEITYHLVVR